MKHPRMGTGMAAFAILIAYCSAAGTINPTLDATGIALGTFFFGLTTFLLGIMSRVVWQGAWD